MRTFLALVAMAGPAALLWAGVRPEATAGTCLLCIWQAAVKDTIWTLHLLLSVWITFLYPVALSIWRPGWTRALALRRFAIETMHQMDIAPDCIAPGYSNLAYRSRSAPPSPEGRS